MPNRDKTGPYGRGRPRRGLGPCSSKRGNKETPSENTDSPGGFNGRRRENK